MLFSRKAHEGARGRTAVGFLGSLLILSGVVVEYGLPREQLSCTRTAYRPGASSDTAAPSRRLRCVRADRSDATPDVGRAGVRSTRTQLSEVAATTRHHWTGSNQQEEPPRPVPSGGRPHLGSKNRSALGVLKYAIDVQSR